MILPRTFERPTLRILCALCVSALSCFLALSADWTFPLHAKQDAQSARAPSREDVVRKSSGCVSCHTSTVEPTMPPTKTVFLGCIDCHGGNSSMSVSTGMAPNSAEYNAAKEKAHVQPRDPGFKNRSA